MSKFLRKLPFSIEELVFAGILFSLFLSDGLFKYSGRWVQSTDFLAGIGLLLTLFYLVKCRALPLGSVPRHLWILSAANLAFFVVSIGQYLIGNLKFIWVLMPLKISWLIFFAVFMCNLMASEKVSKKFVIQCLHFVLLAHFLFFFYQILTRTTGYYLFAIVGTRKPLHAGFTMTMLTCLLFGLALYENNKKYLISGMLSALGGFLVASRITIVTCSVVGIVTFTIFFVRSLTYRRLSFVLGFFSALLLSGVLLWGFKVNLNSLFPPSFGKPIPGRIAGIFTEKTRKAARGRSSHWKNYISAIAHSDSFEIFFGRGSYGQVRHPFVKLKKPAVIRGMDNLLLRVFWNYGLMGALFMAVFFASWLMYLFRHRGDYISLLLLLAVGLSSITHETLFVGKSIDQIFFVTCMGVYLYALKTRGTSGVLTAEGFDSSAKSETI